VKAVVYDRYGPPDLLWVEDVPTPTPSAGQVLDRARHAVFEFIDRIAEIAGPEAYRLDELLRRRLADRGDPREVVADPAARYFDARLDERTLVTGEGARLGATHLDRWLEASAT
jgi:hypothetical protein